MGANALGYTEHTSLGAQRRRQAPAMQLAPAASTCVAGAPSTIATLRKNSLFVGSLEAGERYANLLTVPGHRPRRQNTSASAARRSPRRARARLRAAPRPGHETGLLSAVTVRVARHPARQIRGPRQHLACHRPGSGHPRRRFLVGCRSACPDSAFGSRPGRERRFSVASTRSRSRGRRLELVDERGLALVAIGRLELEAVDGLQYAIAKEIMR